MFTLNGSDLAKGAVMALFMGVALPLAAAIQTPGFDLFTADWVAIGHLALNGAILGLVTYLAKNFLSNSSGKVVGIVG